MADGVTVTKETLERTRDIILASAKTLILKEPKLKDSDAIDLLKILGVWDYINNSIEVRAAEIQYNEMLCNILNERTFNGEYSSGLR